MEEEDIVHFTMVCPLLEKIRSRHGLIDGNISDPKERMLELLFKQNEHQKVGELIRSLWNKRKQILDYKDKEKERQEKMKDVIQNTRSDPGPRESNYTPIRRRSNSLSATKG